MLQDSEVVALLKPREKMFDTDLAYAYILGTALLHGNDTVDGQKSAEGSVAFFTVAFFCAHVPLLLGTDCDRTKTLLIDCYAPSLPDTLEFKAVAHTYRPDMKEYICRPTLPARGGNNPTLTFMQVDLPAPLRPSNPSSLPSPS